MDEDELFDAPPAAITGDIGLEYLDASVAPAATLALEALATLEANADDSMDFLDSSFVTLGSHQHLDGDQVPEDADESMEDQDEVEDEDNDDESLSIQHFEEGLLRESSGQDLEVGDLRPPLDIEIPLPSILDDTLNDYEDVYSRTVERVLDFEGSRISGRRYRVEFSDGREEMLSLDALVEFNNGAAALNRLTKRGGNPSLPRRRSDLSEDEWDSSLDGAVSDRMKLDDADEDEGEDEDENEDEDEDEDDIVHSTRRATVRQSRNLRPREARRESRDLSSTRSDSQGDNISRRSSEPVRNLRTREPKQLLLSEMKLKSRSYRNDQDELALEPAKRYFDDDDEDDHDFLPVISDIALKQKGRLKKAKSQPRRLQNSKKRPVGRPSARRHDDDSDIEFEQPRRSARATKNTSTMFDDASLDDDSFYVVDDRSPAVPKVISIREVFQPVSATSSFGSKHMHYCQTCGNSRKTDPLLYCQGCSSAFHKSCIGYRSGREHQVTKIGPDDFVLQCRFCIQVHKKRDPNAPAHSMCQGCKKHGASCAPFSPKKTSRQEEKIREQNDGVDPISQVSPELINNADNVLFRCVTCYRAWHQDHLPWTKLESIETDLKAEGPKSHSRDWRCQECNATKHKLHRLVAWRPVQQPDKPLADSTGYDDFGEDWKEYLVKWQNLSYAHCTWMPGAWIFGVAAAAMRSSFAKHAIQVDLLKTSEKDAIPEEYLLPDIIFNVKMAANVSRSRSKQADLENVSNVVKIFVKFQGLGYDDVVWDLAPTKENADAYDSFVEAYREYVAGKYFQVDPYPKIRERVRVYKNEPFEELEFQPDGLKRGKLMGYQMEGLNWLSQNYHHGRNVVLADEMGLGKTVQVIGLVTSLIQDRPRCWPFLIVVPNSTCPNWRREFKQWAPDIRVVTYHGGKESQELSYKYELFPNGSADMKAHVVIMSYDSASDPRTPSLFKSVNWAGLVVDEGQRLKNEQSLLYVALRAMKIPFRLLLTGTPLQNNKRELFNLLQFIDETQNAAKLDVEFEILDKETLPKLHDKIRPYFLRRTKAGVLKFLPPMAQIILPVTMTVIQQKLSKSIIAKNPQLIKAVFANSKMAKKERGSLNNILMQLRKCLCHPFMYSEAIEERHPDSAVVHRNLVEASAKLLLLEIMLPKLKERGHRVLIFSQFLQQLDIIEDFLSGIGVGYRRLDGSISSLEKQRRIDAFNEAGSEVFAFLLSTRAGGVGINLATADTVIIMDPDFNPHQDMQALSRAHRIGQKNKVLCFQLVTKDSVEEQIMQVGRKKMALDHALIESMDDDELAGDDLETILKHGAQALFDENYEKSAIQYDSASVDKLLDRSQVEQTATNEEGSGETQFAYARVWANDKLGFESNKDLGEEQAPEPISSSVWDQILAQREEEARREAAANKEELGRGARRRNAINYHDNTKKADQPGDGQSQSDSSEEFSGSSAEASEDEDEDETETDGSQRPMPMAAPAPVLAPVPAPPSVSVPGRPGVRAVFASAKRRGRPPKNSGVNLPQPPAPPNQMAAPTQPAAPPLSAGSHLYHWDQSQRPQGAHHFNGPFGQVPTMPSTGVPPPGAIAGQSGYSAHPLGHSVPPHWPGGSQRPTASPSRRSLYQASSQVEAQIRLAVDAVQRSALPPATKQAQIRVFMEHIEAMRRHLWPPQQ